MTDYTLEVKTQKSGTYGVFARPRRGRVELLEGGFVSKIAALEAQQAWERELLAERVYAEELAVAA